MQIRIDALNRSITGKIVRFTRNVNFETRTMETEVDVENKDLSIAPGMYANTTLELGRAENVMTIPVEALVLKRNQTTVYAVDSEQSSSHRERRVGTSGVEAGRDESGLAAGRSSDLGGQEKYREAKR